MLKENLSALSFLVVGDVMLDRYFWGVVERISPEAPVPVFNLRRITQNLGGAANVAHNLRGLTVGVELAGLVGADREGEEFRALAQEKGIGISALLADETRPTTVKTRIIASAQQLLRIDAEERHPLSPEKKELFLQRLLPLFDRVHGVILSDYAKGLLHSDGLCQEVILEARKRGLPVMIDPKGLDWARYQGATCVTPNTKELFEVAKAEGLHDDDMSTICEHLCRKYQFDFVLVTMGSRGIYLHHPEEKKVFPAKAREVYDVSGAGDTVIATLMTFFVAGLPLDEVVSLANTAAGIVVGKVGTQPILLEELWRFAPSK
jgi:D-beta-D-heptose 7-phosphate kinase/D-beta-D-heptose 1-phosphate adenosyltransferase